MINIFLQTLAKMYQIYGEILLIFSSIELYLSSFRDQLLDFI